MIDPLMNELKTNPACKVTPGGMLYWLALGIPVVAVIYLLLMFLWQATAPHYSAEYKNFHRTMGNMNDLGNTLEYYAKQHEGKLPDDLHPLVPYWISVELLTSPLTGEEITYTKGLTIDMPPDTIVAYDRLHLPLDKNDHRMGRIVLFLDGRVEWMTEDELDLE